MPGVAGSQRLEIAEHGNGLVSIAPLLEGMGQLVGRFGADGACGGVEANGLIAARLSLERPAQLVVNPDIPRMTLLGLRSTDSASALSPATFKPTPSRCRVIGPSSSKFAFFDNASSAARRASASG